MRLLFDQGTPVPLWRHLVGHSVDTAADRDWSDLDNGDLIERAEEDGYEVLITTDQNLSGLRLAIVVLLSTAWPDIRLHVEKIRTAVADVRPGEVKEVPIRLWASRDSVTTDTPEGGRERLICTTLAGRPCGPAKEFCAEARIRQDGRMNPPPAIQGELL